MTTEALIQLTLGAPQLLYNGGILMAPLRYFDAERKRPGLPADVAALVETVERDRLVVHLVNLSGMDARKVLLQAGTLAEHRFGEVAYNTLQSAYPGAVGGYAAPPVEQATKRVAVHDTHFAVALSPGTEIRLEIGLQRHANAPTYDLPTTW